MKNIILKNILVIDNDPRLAKSLVRFIQSFLGSEWCVQGTTTVKGGWELLKQPALLVAEVTENYPNEICEIFENFPGVVEKLVLTCGAPISIGKVRRRLLEVPCLKKPLNEEDLEKSIKAKLGLVVKRRPQ